jgi:hypothetical protein
MRVKIFHAKQIFQTRGVMYSRDRRTRLQNQQVRILRVLADAARSTAICDVT